MSEHWFESEPDWFRTAVFYELHTRTFFVSDLLGGERYRWTIGRNFVRLGPGQAHVFKVETRA